MQVLRQILLEGSRPALLGALAGTVAALLLSRLLASLLFDVAPGDPVTLVGVAAVLAAVSLASGLLPALHAARVDPAVTLRAD